MAPEKSWRVKHLRLFGFYLDPETAAVRWLLHHAGKYDVVEHVDVDAIAGEIHTEAFESRNPFQTVPFLEVVVEGTGPRCTKPISELTPWKPESPCTVKTSNGETIATPTDRVFPLSETGAICSFLCEHFGITELWNPRSVFQRCRAHEIITHNDLLSRRIGSMLFVFLFTKADGSADEDIVTAITAHERELLWSFRHTEDILGANEASAATAAGLDYAALLEQANQAPRAEAASDESEETKTACDGAEPPALSLRADDPDDSARSPAFTNPALLALGAYLGGRQLSLSDFSAATYIQLLPYLQSWLPESLRQRNFPATMRYLGRMRRVEGFDTTLKPRLAFLKRFRRRPAMLTDNPVIQIHVARLKQCVDLRDSVDGRTARSDPRLLPQQHCRAVQGARGDSSNAASRRGPARGRPQDPLADWAPRICAVPMYSPCTLTESDEQALRKSKRPERKRAAPQSVDSRKPKADAETSQRSKTAQPCTRPRHPSADVGSWRVRQHDPYGVSSVARMGPLPVQPRAFSPMAAPPPGLVVRVGGGGPPLPRL